MTDVREGTQALPPKWVELKRLAEAATPGPWFHIQPFQVVPAVKTIHGTVPGCRVDFVDTKPTIPHGPTIIPMQHEASITRSSDMAFIAAANPAAVLELIAALAEKDAEIARLLTENQAREKQRQDMQRLLDDGRREFAALRASKSDGWISVDDRFPEEGQMVCVIFNGIIQHMMYTLAGRDWEPVDEDADSAPIGVFSHWMPLPEPPAPQESAK